MINVGNSATYDSYLFSACLNNGTCDGLNPDPISQALLTTTSHCGSWGLSGSNYTWDYNNNRWV
jgi:hypothetical protein